MNFMHGMFRITLSLMAGIGAIAATLVASQGQMSPYAGEQTRKIKALSESSIQSLLNGEGMGLARAAELNRYPGPMHVLELKSELKLTEQQLKRTQNLFKEMRTEARELGRKVVDAESRLEMEFARGSATEAKIATQTEEIARLQGKLRYCHLKAHLKMVAILSKWQVAEYNRLRGYGA